MPAYTDHKRIPELNRVYTLQSGDQLVVYSAALDQTMRLDYADLVVEGAEFTGYVVYQYIDGGTNIFGRELVMAERGNSIYRLAHPARPYESTDFPAELAAGDWVLVGSGGGASLLSELGDVALSGTATGDVLYRSGNVWVNRTLTATDVGALDEATADTLYAAINHNHDGVYAPVAHDHDTDYADINHTHTFASITSKPTTLAGYGITDGLTKPQADLFYSPLGHAHYLDDLLDVSIAGATTGQILSKSVSGWVAVDPPAGGTGSTTLAGLTDVTISGGVNGQVLYLSNGQWINHTLTAANIGALTQATADTLYMPIDATITGNYLPLVLTQYEDVNVGAYGIRFSGFEKDGDGFNTGKDFFAGFGNNYMDWSLRVSKTGSIRAKQYVNPDMWLSLDYGAGESNTIGSYSGLEVSNGTSYCYASAQAAPLEGRFEVYAKASGGTEGTFEVRPDGLYWNKTAIVFGGGGGSGATTLDELTDVTLTTPVNGAVLQYNGSQWIDADLSSVYIKTNSTTGQNIEQNNNLFTITNSAFNNFWVDGGDSYLAGWDAITGTTATADGSRYMRAEVRYGAYSVGGSLFNGVIQNKVNQVGGEAELEIYSTFGGSLLRTKVIGNWAVNDYSKFAQQFVFTDSVDGDVTWEIRPDGIYRNDTQFGSTVSATPVALTDATTTNMDLGASYNFTWAISSGNKTLVPQGTGFVTGANWTVRISGCAGQTLFLGPTTGYTHYLATAGGTGQTVTSVVLPASGRVVLSGHRFGTEIYWIVTEF